MRELPWPSVLTAHARDVPSEARALLAARLEPDLAGRGALLLGTCHRVEAWLPAGTSPIAARLPAPVRQINGEAAARHVLCVAVGLDSVVLAEDQLLHQLRAEATRARSRGPLDPALDRLVQLALRAGRRARSWRVGRGESLADVALARLPAGGSILVVGTGDMGRLAAAAVRRRGDRLLVAGRTPANAAELAERSGGAALGFVPEADVLATVRGVIVALRGAWPLPPARAAALVSGGAVVVDLSSPPALAPELRARLGQRLHSIDALARERSGDDRLARRLERLVEEALAEYAAWLRGRAAAAAAAELTARADETRRAALERLWRELPAYDGATREAVERMSRHLVARILDAPLARLGSDPDGARERAARELFDL
ncbi:MAG TPA: hypothetical protein VFK38_07720 [Candidatus Limnocylindrales bacterium]|nr:hypothetical protein [Candidatus Limnocylindrales bacterium]